MLARIKKYLISLHKDERGAMAVEKVLIIALVAIPILILLAIFKNKIIGWFKTKDTDLSQYNDT